jgi:hypothetical protein
MFRASIAAALARAVPGAACALALAAPVPALAQQKGDQWELTVKMEIPGMPMNVPPTTTRLCLAKNARDEALVPQKNDECKFVESRKTGDTLRYKMACTGKDPMTMEGEVTYAGDTYAGKSKMTGSSGGQAFEMSHTYSGRKVGECANPIGAR